MAVMKEVAKLAGVSVGTVSKYLNNHHTLKEETKRRVEEAIHTLQYKPNLLARSMRTGKTKTLAVIVPDIVNPFFAETFTSIKLSALQKGYTAILYTTDDSPETMSQYLSGMSIHHVDGLILCFVNTRKVIDDFTGIHPETPMVFLGWDIGDTRYNSVVIDVYEGIYASTRHLIQLGHRKIAYVGGPENDMISGDKFNGYMKAMAVSGYEADPRYIFHNNYTLQSGYNSARKLAMLPDMPTALVAENDILAIGCMKYFLQKKISIPEDIAIIGFDNIPLAAMYEPSLSTVALPITRMGEEAVKIMLSRIDKPALKNKQMILKTDLIVRNSTQKGTPLEFEI